MARYRDERGRFISSADVEQRRSSGGGLFRALFGALVQEETFEPGDEEAGFYVEPNWYEEDNANTVVWTTGDPNNPMAPGALDGSEPPPGMARFQVRFTVPSNPSYPRGYASYDSLDIGEWPPSPEWGSHLGATGIGAIIFSRY